MSVSAGLVLAACACAAFAGSTAWSARTFRGRPGRGPAVAFALSQLALAATVTAVLAMGGAGTDSFLGLMADVCLLLSSLALPLLMRRLLKAADEERDLRQAETLAEQVEAQERHLGQMRESLESARHLRADMREQALRARDELDGMAGAAGGSEAREAGQTLQGMGEALRGRGARLCANPVVDALLAMKAQACREHGVELRCEAPLPEELPLASAELCAVYANMLDNAIHACDALPEGQRAVALQTYVSHGMLVARVRNSCPERGDGAGPAASEGRRRRHERASGLAEHGWGLVILEELARAHDGELRTEAQGPTFTTTLTLNLAGAQRDRQS